ncbi:class E sortase [Streptomyces spinosirectus]|uniref:class E sortase n=1 Tax=Streptomyces TaxID=1883 RepID=UPI000D37FEF4|nr:MULTISPECIES: class E sortase [Streptomyces]MBY8344829.1 class E sortase [Streptomyces plumbidurans]PTM91174.1 sortase A [Streptomyces sp. VMFN-G11Ma]UIR20163.1 class E sortase [Streptomyces spinosirectus]
MRVPVVQHSSRRRLARRRRVWWTGGEVLVTVGVVLLLLVVQQLWWTNREARRGAERKVEALERDWGDGGSDDGGGGGSATSPPASSPERHGAGGAADGSGAQRATAARQSRPDWSQAYAILAIPRLGLRVPVAEGVSKQNVLNKGYVGHYRGTGQPGQAGNFALAGHRNTHGEPFRYINRLRAKDVVRVETRTATYTYAVDKTLPQTAARDSGVIRPIPRSIVKPRYGYSEPGYYITLTTCTPEYTSRYRLVVWGKLVSMRPRG